MNWDQVLKSFREIDWDIDTDLIDSIRLDDEDISLPRDLKVLYNTPINPPLKELILYFPKTRYPEEHFPPKREIYRSERGFTPFEILGAIYTFYNKPISREVLELYADEDVEYAEEALQAENPKRIYLLGSMIRFTGLEPYEDGYEVSLET